ncbi:MAG: mandelate racemase/muconate lactonizing enzyme family protein [Anaerolineae bacterium]
MKIIDMKCAVIGYNPIVRILTDEGIYGHGEAESTKSFLKPHIMFYKPFILGEDPTNVESVMIKIRRLGSFKPWGSAVSAIEMALWDIAGKAAGVPVYKLLGGKVRDKVRVYNGGVRFPMSGLEPEDFADNVAKMKASPEGFSLVKQGIGFHSPMPVQLPDFHFGDAEIEEARGHSIEYYLSRGLTNTPHSYRGLLTEKGLKHMIACVEAMKDVLGDEVGLALDCGPGWMPTDVIRFAKATEHLNLMWLEDTVNGDYQPYVLADVYRDITMKVSTPIHTGEQIYLRQNFKELIEKQAVNIIGPDPADIGGIAELKWVAEYADLHGILIAPHGIFDGLFGLAAHVQVAATLPSNFIGFEYPVARPDWWYNIVDGLPEQIVKDSLIEVWDTPGLGVDFNVDKAHPYLLEEDKDFFD